MLLNTWKIESITCAMFCHWQHSFDNPSFRIQHNPAVFLGSVESTEHISYFDFSPEIFHVLPTSSCCICFVILQTEIGSSEDV